MPDTMVQVAKNKSVTVRIDTPLTIFSDVGWVVEQVRDALKSSAQEIIIEFPPNCRFASPVVADLVVCVDLVSRNGGTLIVSETEGEVRRLFTTLGVDQMVEFCGPTNS